MFPLDVSTKMPDPTLIRHSDFGMELLKNLHPTITKRSDMNRNRLIEMGQKFGAFGNNQYSEGSFPTSVNTNSIVLPTNPLFSTNGNSFPTVPLLFGAGLKLPFDLDCKFVPSRIVRTAPNDGMVTEAISSKLPSVFNPGSSMNEAGSLASSLMEQALQGNACIPFPHTESDSSSSLLECGESMNAPGKMNRGNRNSLSWHESGQRRSESATSSPSEMCGTKSTEPDIPMDLSLRSGTRDDEETEVTSSSPGVIKFQPKMGMDRQSRSFEIGQLCPELASSSVTRPLNNKQNSDSYGYSMLPYSFERAQSNLLEDTQNCGDRRDLTAIDSSLFASTPLRTFDVNVLATRSRGMIDSTTLKCGDDFTSLVSTMKPCLNNVCDSIPSPVNRQLKVDADGTVTTPLVANASRRRPRWNPTSNAIEECEQMILSEAVMDPIVSSLLEIPMNRFSTSPAGVPSDFETTKPRSSFSVAHLTEM
ncbi:unnamed protein product [Echinostoma caproni]|uniref:Protein kinase domain-containing protein n=1 Tax=Echinostoma caproni TaxID=27848 RepID=A0A183AFG8_9TREM|nr:unnamed protein product [Echinostoma caproni]